MGGILQLLLKWRIIIHKVTKKNGIEQTVLSFVDSSYKTWHLHKISLHVLNVIGLYLECYEPYYNIYHGTYDNH